MSIKKVLLTAALVSSMAAPALAFQNTFGGEIDGERNRIERKLKVRLGDCAGTSKRRVTDMNGMPMRETLCDTWIVKRGNSKHPTGSYIKVED